jgi:hypothetical protein
VSKVPEPTACVIRATFESPPDPNRFSSKERGRFVAVVLFPENVKRQFETVTVAKARALEIARQQINDRIEAPDLDVLETSTEILTLDLSPLGEVHRTLDDGTKVWLTEVERWQPPMEQA